MTSLPSPIIQMTDLVRSVRKRAEVTTISGD